MTDSARAIVRRALDEVKPFLRSYVHQKMAGARSRGPARDDVQAYLSAILKHWESRFSVSLPPTFRHYVFELKDVRNRWAHEEQFSLEEAHRAVDTARLIAKAIGAPPAVLESLHGLTGDSRSPAPTPSQQASRQSIEPRREPRAAPLPRVEPKVNGDGVILNVEELSAEQVAMKRVLCPACNEKVFEEWSAGWDAHAAHRCSGLTTGSPEERKEEYRTRFLHLFRARPRSLGLRSQRDVMREIWTRCHGNEERAVREYAEAERRGEVQRTRNKFALSAEIYARALIRDGVRKGWLR